MVEELQNRIHPRIPPTKPQNQNFKIYETSQIFSLRPLVRFKRSSQNQSKTRQLAFPGRLLYGGKALGMRYFE